MSDQNDTCLTPKRIASDTTVSSFEDYCLVPSSSLMTVHKLKIRDYPNLDDQASEHDPSIDSSDANKNHDIPAPG